MSLLAVEGAMKRFAGVVAVDRIDLAVDAGELLGLFGPNGAGKTTLFNLIAGAFYADGGTIRFRGQEITRLPAYRRARLGIARTFQIVRPFRDLSVIDNLRAVVPSDAAAETPVDAYALLEQVGLAGRARDPAGTLTLGMLKRLEVARGLMLSPRLFLLDEPLAGLTDREADDMLSLVSALKSRMAVIMVEHNVRQALPICDRALVMDAGSRIAEGSPAEIRVDPAVIRAYLGQEQA